MGRSLEPWLSELTARRLRVARSEPRGAGVDLLVVHHVAPGSQLPAIEAGSVASEIDRAALATAGSHFEFHRIDLRLPLVLRPPDGVGVGGSRTRKIVRRGASGNANAGGGSQQTADRQGASRG